MQCFGVIACVFISSAAASWTAAAVVSVQAECIGEACSSIEEHEAINLLQYGAVQRRTEVSRQSLKEPETAPELQTEPRITTVRRAALTAALVDEVYTFGAPATHNPPFRNAANENGCFPGLRSYTEDMIMWDQVHKVDAAAHNNDKPHAAMNTVVLHWQADSIYIKCNGGTHLGHTDWPRHDVSTVSDWLIHQEPNYVDRLDTITIDGKNVSDDEPFRSAKMFALLAFRAYEPLDTIQQLLPEQMPGWRLVDRGVYNNLVDSDPVLLMQHPETLECALAFTGTNYFEELGTSVMSFGTGYCGFTDVHAGYRNELWTLTNDRQLWEPIRSKLGRCSRVICAGHSLGGSLCEIFAACANSGNFSDPDYQLLAWNRRAPERMPTIGG